MASTFPSTSILYFLIWSFLFTHLALFAQTETTIYWNGPILTMNDEQPTVEAIKVSQGRIVAVGSLNDLSLQNDPHTVMYDLEGKTMIPGFIDAHSHFTIAMKTIRWADLSPPPVGDVANIGALLEKLKEHIIRKEIKPGEWITGWGYDPDQLEELRHPTASELTKAFPHNPVFLLHVSAHMAVANDLALNKADITRITADPPGGKIVRVGLTNDPTGLLQESALHLVLPLLPVPDQSELLNLFEETQEYYASHGITTAQDGLTDYQTYTYLKYLANQGLFQLDLNLLAAYTDADSFLSNAPFGTYQNGLTVTGLKIISDGSPQGKTAYFRDPYLTEVPGCAHTCVGFPTIEKDRLYELMRQCYSKGVQLYVHANGDGAIELLLNTHEEVTRSLDNKIRDLRTVVIHSQFVGKDQLEKYADYGFIPSFFTNHAFFWGDVHTRNLGIDRASTSSPLRSAMEQGIIATNHTDFTVTPLNQLFLLWTSVNRLTRSGKILGPEERLTPLEGLKHLTINSAFQHKLEKVKGSLTPGKIADLVILDQNPLAVLPGKIKDIIVVETIKEGKTIYRRNL